MPPPFAHFDLIEEIGVGAIGVTYRARDTRTGVLVAVKVVHDDLVRGDDVAARLRHEARIAAELDHPNIARLIEFGEYAGTQYIVSEYIEGESLRERLRREGHLPEGEAHRIALCVAHALNAAWAQRVVHRGLTPANILLGQDASVGVCDFGLAQAMDIVTPSHIGAFIPVPAYAAPELQDRRADVRTDLYALGVIMFEMLTGRLPSGVAHRDASATPHPDKTSDAALLQRTSKTMAAIVLRLIEPSPQNRYPDPSELVVALERLQHFSPIPVSDEALAAADITRRRLLFGAAGGAFRLRRRARLAATNTRLRLATIIIGVLAFAAALRNWSSRCFAAGAALLRSGATSARRLSRAAALVAAAALAVTMIGGGLLVVNAVGGGREPARSPDLAAAKPKATATSHTSSPTRSPATRTPAAATAPPSLTSTPRSGVAGIAATPRPPKNESPPKTVLPPPALDGVPQPDAPPLDASPQAVGSPVLSATAFVATSTPIPTTTSIPTTEPTIQQPTASFTPEPSSTPLPPTETAVSTPTAPPTFTSTATPTPVVKCADVNRTGRVTNTDVQLISARSGRNLGQLGYAATFDLNDDGTIDAADIGIAASQLGRLCRQ